MATPDRRQDLNTRKPESLFLRIYVSDPMTSSRNSKLQMDFTTPAVPRLECNFPSITKLLDINTSSKKEPRRISPIKAAQWCLEKCLCQNDILYSTCTRSSRRSICSARLVAGHSNVDFDTGTSNQSVTTQRKLNAVTQITNFGDNPTGVENYVYVPAALADPPALIAAIHYCTGTAQAYYNGTQYATLAEEYGFIVLYPEAPAEGKCWDVHTNETLTHDAGGDSLGIVNGLRYLIDLYGVDPDQVFATGTSSGAMMTNVLAGAYPDLIRAGAAFAGV